jgi:hypothetical protein
VPPILTPEDALMLGINIDDPEKHLQKIYDGTMEQVEQQPEDDEDD